MVSIHNMVSPQNDDTRGGPPSPPIDATGLNLGLVKSDTVLPTARHRYYVSKGAVLCKRNDAEIGHFKLIARFRRNIQGVR